MARRIYKRQLWYFFLIGIVCFKALPLGLVLTAGFPRVSAVASATPNKPPAWESFRVHLLMKDNATQINVPMHASNQMKHERSASTEGNAEGWVFTTAKRYTLKSHMFEHKTDPFQIWLVKPVV